MRCSTPSTPRPGTRSRNLLEFGNALAGRGVSLNAVIGELRPLVERLEPVMRNLASPDTASRFVSALSAAAAEAAPVAEIQGSSSSISRRRSGPSPMSRGPTSRRRSRSPGDRDVAIDTLPEIRPFLSNTAVLFSELRPGFHAFAPVSKRRRPSYWEPRRLDCHPPSTRSSTRQLSRCSTSPTIRSRRGNPGPHRLQQRPLPPLSFITPVQSVCNYATMPCRTSPAWSGSATASGPISAPSSSASRSGRTASRAQLRARRRSRHQHGELPPLQPLSEHRLPGQERSARQATRPTWRARW
jgi:hypothetical protein